MNNTLKVLTGIAVGAAAGSVVALLTAPNSGKTSRKKIQKEIDKAKGKLESSINHNLEAIKTQYNTSVSRAAAKGKALLNKVEKPASVNNDA